MVDMRQVLFSIFILMLVIAALLLSGCHQDDDSSENSEPADDDDVADDDTSDDDTVADDDTIADDDTFPDDDDDDTADDDSCLQPGADCTLGETAADAGIFVGAAVPSDPEDPRLSLVSAHFNSLTAENAMKWGELSYHLGDYDYTTADALLAFAEDNGLRVRGHALVWGKYPGHGYPADLETLIGQSPDPYAFVQTAIADHVATVVGRYAGRIESWDVVNEPLSSVGTQFDPNPFYLAMGADYIAAAFMAAREADPDARLFLNEYFLVYDTPKTDALLDLLEDLLAQGVPIDGVGIQGHLFVSEPLPERLHRFLTAIEALGLDIELTELDVAKNVLWDDMLNGQTLFEAQADAYDLLAAACFDVASCTGLTVWGIDDSRTWLDELFPFNLFAPNNPLLFDRDLAPKPAYFAIRERIAEAFSR